MKHESDFLLPFQLENTPVRGRLVRLENSLQEISGRHQYHPAINQLLGEAVALCAALADFFKFKGVFTLQVKGDGPLRLMVVDITDKGHVRACARYDKDQVSRLPEGTASLRTLAGSGYLALTLDQSRNDNRYQGIVELTGETLAECLHHFFRQSDQVETGIAVFSDADPGDKTSVSGNCLAGALIIQRMPSPAPLAVAETGVQDDAWLHLLSILGTVTTAEMLDAGLPAEDLLYRLFWENGIRVFQKSAITARCRCSREKLEGLLKTFSLSDIEAMVNDEKIVVTCEFCNQSYSFDAPPDNNR